MSDRTPRSDGPNLFSAHPKAVRERIVTDVILDRAESTPVPPPRGRATPFRLNDDGVQPGGPDDRLLLWPEVQNLVGFSRTTAWRMQRAGLFPWPIPVSPGRVGWRESELNAWKRARRGAEPVPGRAPGGERRFSPPGPPSPPRLPGMPLSSRENGPSRERAPGSATTGSVPPQSPTPPPPPPCTPPAVAARKPRRRSPGPDPAQTDFGF
ncbi:MAG: helix-turn-helix transcriptional regulator [Brevundimonas aurantiaca]|uniref:helix-turn-helix transcriptional regulator n=1 Tax=Brevundimonas aurantiaca TaxID=74316 RepID=UPI00403455C1